MASIEKQLLGTETVRALRAKGVDCTICGLSANDKAEEFIEAGADAFMSKPFPCGKEELSKKILLVLEKGKRRLARGA
jgi:DNA-binding response OmpR family regulator